MIRTGLLGPAIVPATACATLFASKSTVIPMSSNPAGAEVYIDGVQRGTAPTSIELSHKREYTVVFKRQGLQDAVCQIDRSVGAGWIVLDVLGGLIPVIIDAATGAWHSLKVKNCNVNLTTADEREANAPVEEIWFGPSPRRKEKNYDDAQVDALSDRPWSVIRCEWRECTNGDGVQDW